MFSEMMRMRPAWARSPDAAIAIDFRKSTAVLLACWNLAACQDSYVFACPFRKAGSHFSGTCASTTLANGGLEETEAARIERGRRLVIHLVGGDLDHLVLEVDGVAGGAHVVAARPRRRKAARTGNRPLDMCGLGAIERHARRVLTAAEVGRREIARAIFRRVGVGDV